MSQTDPFVEFNALDEAPDAICLRAHKLTRLNDLPALAAQAGRTLEQLRRQPAFIEAEITAIADRLMLCLLLDHGLGAGELRFRRPKVNKTQTHRLTRDTLAAARAYLTHDAPAAGPLFHTSRRGGQLAGGALCAVGFQSESGGGEKPPIARLQDAGARNSPAMPPRYVEAAKVANWGVRV